MRLKKQYNTQFVGVLTGLFIPILVALFFYLLNVERFGGTERLIRYINAINSMNDIITKLMSLFVLPDLLLFFYFNWQNFLRAARGVLLATFIYAGIIIYMKFF